MKKKSKSFKRMQINNIIVFHNDIYTYIIIILWTLKHIKKKVVIHGRWSLFQPTKLFFYRQFDINSYSHCINYLLIRMKGKGLSLYTV